MFVVVVVFLGFLFLVIVLCPILSVFRHWPFLIAPSFSFH